MKHPSMVAAFDLVVCLLLVFVILALVQKTTPPAIQTLGTYAVEIQWADGAYDDVDLYVRDPDGNICFFDQPDVNLLHLEYDHLGRAATPGVEQSSERIIIRGVQAGEYVVNVHMYQKDDPGPQRVRVRVYRLAGADTLLAETTVVLRAYRDERTALRFVVQPDGSVTDWSDLQVRFVQ